MSDLRSRVVEAGARAIANDRADEIDEWHFDDARVALDAMLDCLAEFADEVADVMAKEVGDYWTHQTRRALFGLLAVLRESP